jgi:hypothetical protein
MSKLLPAFLFLLAASTVPAQTLDFGQGWEIAGQGSTVGPHLGKNALRLGTGNAYRRDVRLEDGTLELDVATTGRRSFFYVQFRMASDGEFEEIYLRPHKTGLGDALQYNPVYRGESNWQLFHGEGATAPVDIPRNEWVHLKIVLRGERAAIFVGDSKEPQLVVRRLARPAASGYVALRSFVPEGGAEPVTSFANVVVRPDATDFAFPEIGDEPTPPSGIVREWLVSEPFVTPDGPITELPAVANWKEIETERSGLLVLLRHIARPERGKRATVLAKQTLTTTSAARVPFHLGYSDEVTVFLNGAPLFTADDSYSFDRPRREGLIGLDQATVYLPLRTGENELVLAVTDVFGGWGLMGLLGRVDSNAVAVSLR